MLSKQVFLLNAFVLISILSTLSNPTSAQISKNTTAVQLHNRNEAIIVGVFTAQADIPLTYEIVKPALDLAMEEVRIRFPHLKFTLVTKKSNNTCLCKYICNNNVLSLLASMSNDS